MYNLYKNELFANIETSWKNIITKEECIKILFNIIRTIDNDLKKIGYNKENNISDYITPHPKNIFRAFKYFSIKDLKVILIGQDPYPQGANGLCFSHDKKFQKKGDSMANIIKCIENTCKIKIDCNDIEKWTNNNTLLLNTILTRYTNESIKKGLLKKSIFWESFIIYILREISSYKYFKNNEIFIMLWGNESQKLEKYLKNDKFKILKWTHPSPMTTINNDISNPKHFMHCNHFKTIQNSSTFIFKFNKVYIFTDGACIGNGKITAKGSYAFYIPQTFNNQTNYSNEIKFSEIIKPNFYKCTDGDSEIQIHPNIEKKEKITNSRTELLGIISALLFVINNRINKNYESIILVSDSMYVINQFNEKHNTNANNDLVDIMLYLKKYINNIKTLHQYSHTNKSNKKNKITLNDENKDILHELVKGNDIVDKLASNLINPRIKIKNNGKKIK